MVKTENSFVSNIKGLVSDGIEGTLGTRRKIRKSICLVFGRPFEKFPAGLVGSCSLAVRFILTNLLVAWGFCGENGSSIRKLSS